MINKNDLRKAISSIAISNAKRNTIYKAFSDLDSITKEEFDSVKSDISKVVESMLTKDTVGKANGVASLDSNGSVPIEQLGNIDTTLFLIVRELPTTDIKTNKIYLIPNKDAQGNNIYVEYLYVENVWENLGEFKAEVDLSEYINKLSTEIIYDVSARNNGVVFESLQSLLSSPNLSTLIPTSVRHGGMSIRFVQSSDNKYVQYRLMANTFSTTVTDWQGVDDEPTTGSDNLVKSGGVADSINWLKNAGYLYAGIATPTKDPGTPDRSVFYIANGKGAYTNFDGINVTEDEVVILYYDTIWHKDVTGIASDEKLTKLEQKVNNNETTLYGSTDKEYISNEVCTIDGYLVNATDGELKPFSAYTCASSNFINVVGCSNISIKGYLNGITSGLAFYDKNKVFLSGISSSNRPSGFNNTTYTAVSIPNGTFYIRFSYFNNENLYVFVSNTFAGLVDKVYRIEEITADLPSIREKVDAIGEEPSTKTYDGSVLCVKAGYGIAHDTGLLKAQSICKCTETFIALPTKGDVAITGELGNTLGIAFYSAASESSYLGGYAMANMSGYKKEEYNKLVVPDGSKYFRFSIIIGYTPLQVKVKTSGSGLWLLSTRIDENKDEINALNGKFDSIIYTKENLINRNLENNTIGSVVKVGGLSTYWYGIFPCNGGGTIYCKTSGGTGTARGFAFLDAEQRVISCHAGGEVDGTFVAPVGTEYVCTNCKRENVDDYSLQVFGIKRQMADLNQKVGNIGNQFADRPVAPQIYQNSILQRDINTPIKILVFGSSWFNCTYWYLPFLLKSIGVNAEIHCCYIGGGSFAQWLRAYDENQLFDNTSATNKDALVSINGGDWQSETINFATHIHSKKWDFIGFQQGALAGINWESYENYWSDMVRIVGTIARGTANIGYNATYTPPYWSETNLGRYGYELSIDGQRQFQKDNNENIKRFMSLSGIRNVSPCGATMWSIRRDADMNNGDKDMATDGMHPDSGLACYALAATFYETFFAPMFGVSIDDVDWIPNESTQRVHVSDKSIFRAISAVEKAKIARIVHQSLSDRFGFNA